MHAQFQQYTKTPFEERGAAFLFTGAQAFSRQGTQRVRIAQAPLGAVESQQPHGLIKTLRMLPGFGQRFEDPGKKSRKPVPGESLPALVRRGVGDREATHGAKVMSE
jgi:hypothetical protein